MSKETRPDPDRRPARGGVPIWAWVLLASIILPGVGLPVLFISSKIPSGSMVPTLLVGDSLFVRRGGGTPPRRGEVIQFPLPENRSQEFLKRVIALPGDTFEALDGRPVVNGWLAPHCHVGSFTTEGPPRELYVEYLGDATYGTVFDKLLDERVCKAAADCGEGQACRGGACGRLQGPFQVKRDEVYVMGDNRDNSHDSRTWRGGLGGGVPIDTILGSAKVIWSSASGGRAFTGVQGPPALPPEAAALQGALDKCVRERPPAAQTTPPRP